MAPIRVPCRPCLATRTSRRRRFTLTLPTCICARPTIDFIRGRRRRVRTGSGSDRVNLDMTHPGQSNPTIEVTRTYLEMRDPSELQPARSDDPLISIEPQPDCSVALFRMLYGEVGRNYHWIDRLPWTDEDIAKHLLQPEISVWLMTYDGQMAGYFELRKCEDGS